MIFGELHRIQDDPANGGYLPESKLRELSKRTGWPLYRLQEVASFYPHFRLTPPAKVEVRICRDMTCHIRGADKVLSQLRSLTGELGSEQLHVDGVSCLGRCDRGPIACVNHHYLSRDSLRELPRIIRGALSGQAVPHDGDRPLSFVKPKEWKINPYSGKSDYQAVRAFIADPDSKRVLKEIETAELLGMGGAGAPAVRKWTDVRQAFSADGEKYIVCNGDESEPGTFKDREILTHAPHLVVEGVVFAGLVIGATRGYIFIRHEYPEQIASVRRAIADAESQRACGTKIAGSDRVFPIEVVCSPGGYILGEQGALIEALEGNRGQPRNRPPQLETNGLRNKPTLLSNVETYAWAPAIAIRGGEWYAGQGMNGSKGLRFFSVSGDVKRPGAYEVPIGLPFGELINTLCGGTLDDELPAAIAPSGPSGGFLPPFLPVSGGRVPDILKDKVRPDGTLSLYDLPLDLGLFRQLGLMLGAGIVVYGRGRDMLDQALNCLQFFRNETCGKCVPCRLGTNKLVEIGRHISGCKLNSADFSADKEDVRQLAQVMEMTSICGLGVAAPNPLVTWLKYFDKAPAAAEKPSIENRGHAGNR